MSNWQHIQYFHTFELNSITTVFVVHSVCYIFILFIFKECIFIFRPLSANAESTEYTTVVFCKVYTGM